MPPAYLDPTGLALDGSLHVGDVNLAQSVQTLAGNGTILSNVVIGTSGVLAPGPAAGFGTLTISNNLTVGDATNGGGNITMAIDHVGYAAEVDSVAAARASTFWWKTAARRPRSRSTREPTICIAATFSRCSTLPATPASPPSPILRWCYPATGPVSAVTYVWNTNQLAVNGELILAVGAPVQPPPVFGAATLSAGKVVLKWDGRGAVCRVSRAHGDQSHPAFGELEAGIDQQLCGGRELWQHQLLAGHEQGEFLYPGFAVMVHGWGRVGLGT
jgi:hypothetical protein